MNRLQAVLGIFYILTIVCIPFLSATEFGYNYLDKRIDTNTTNNYINNTFINQTITTNTTQFETGEPVTIKLTWLESFINSLSKWLDYYTKDEMDTSITTQTLIANKSDWGYWMNDSCIVIGNLSYISQC